MHRLHSILLFAYPIAVHLSLIAEHREWALWALVIVSLSQLVLLFHSQQSRLWLSLAPATVLGLAILGLFKNSVFALYLPPVLISAGLLWLFASSLFKGREPIISSFARVVFQEKDPEILHYTRRVTQLWSLFFVGMLLETILLAALAPLPVWSLFANILNYLFIALLFAAEFSYRRLRYPQRTSLTETIRKIARTDWLALAKGSRS